MVVSIEGGPSTQVVYSQMSLFNHTVCMGYIQVMFSMRSIFFVCTEVI